MRTLRIQPFLYTVALTIVCLGPGATHAADTVDTEALYQQMQILTAEIEQIRQVMGRRAPRARRFSLSDVETRQTYFQAQTLFRKTNTLAREIAGVSRQSPTPAPDRDITNADVMGVLKQAGSQIALVKQALSIDTPVAPAPARRKSQADVMHDIIEAGYVLNAMIAEQPDWVQIYDRVYQIVTYVGGALPAEVRYPPMPEFVCCQLPQAVYQRLLQAMEATRPLAQSVDLNLVRVKPIVNAEGGASPATVYDLTTTLVSDFGELTLRLDGEDIAGPEYPRPTRILPSHVYQLAGVLEAQVKLLIDR